MLVSTLIDALRRIKVEHGDTQVEVWEDGGNKVGFAEEVRPVNIRPEGDPLYRAAIIV